MSFRKLKGIRLSEAQQGLLYYTCQTYASQPKRIRERIARLCDKHGGEHSRALFELLTTDRSAVSVSLQYHVSDRTLYRLRREFYAAWYGEPLLQGRRR